MTALRSHTEMTWWEFTFNYHPLTCTHSDTHSYAPTCADSHPPTCTRDSHPPVQRTMTDLQTKDEFFPQTVLINFIIVVHLRTMTTVSSKFMQTTDQLWSLKKNEKRESNSFPKCAQLVALKTTKTKTKTKKQHFVSLSFLSPCQVLAQSQVAHLVEVLRLYLVPCSTSRHSLCCMENCFKQDNRYHLSLSHTHMRTHAHTHTHTRAHAGKQTK